MSVQTILVGVCVFLFPVEPGSALPIPIEVDVDLQSRIDRAIRAGTNPELKSWEQMTVIEKELREIAETRTEDLVRQVLYYYADHIDEERLAWSVMTLPHYFHINKGTLAHAVYPYIHTEHKDVRREVRRSLRYIENSTAGLPPDFSYYRHLITDVAAQEEPPGALIRYMFERSRGHTVAELARIYYFDFGDRERRKDLLWAEHVVSDAVWKKRQHFPEAAAKARPEAVEQLRKLSQHKDWWARLYVAEILKRHPEFRTAEMVDRLNADDHELVRLAMENDDK